MRRLSLLCAALGVTITALAASSPAEAAFHVIRWDNTGWCQVWDPSTPLNPLISKYVAVSRPIPSLTPGAGRKGRAPAQGHLQALASNPLSADPGHLSPPGRGCPASNSRAHPPLSHQRIARC